MENWYALQTKAYKEAVVATQLERSGVESYLPRIAERLRAGLHVQKRIVPMFPCYLFVLSDLEDSARTLRFTPGVRDFVRVGGAPEPIDADTIEHLKARVGPRALYEPPARRFFPGERLRITEAGPLCGLDVIFERELSGPERVAVLLAEVKLAARIVLSSESLCSA